MGQKHLIAKQVDSDLILYNPELDEVHTLNATAKVIFELICKGKSLGDIEKELASRFSFEEGHDILRDIHECVDLLKKKGLISEGPVP